MAGSAPHQHVMEWIEGPEDAPVPIGTSLGVESVMREGQSGQLAGRLAITGDGPEIDQRWAGLVSQRRKEPAGEFGDNGV